MVIRPEDVDIVPEEQGQLKGTVTAVTFKGDAVRHHRGLLRLQVADPDHRPVPEVGSRIGIKIDPDGIHVMKKSQYSGMFGDYSSYSEEYEEINDATFDTEEEDQEGATMKSKRSWLGHPLCGLDGPVHGGPHHAWW